MKKVLLIPFITLLFGFIAIAQTSNVVDEVSSAIKAANTREIAKHFSQTVELTLVDDENIYSKTQAEIVLREFFAKYPPTNFVIKHRGGSAEGSQYAIATYTTNKGSYRAYFYLKQTSGKLLLNELRFEKER